MCFIVPTDAHETPAFLPLRSWSHTPCNCIDSQIEWGGVGGCCAACLLLVACCLLAACCWLAGWAGLEWAEKLAATARLHFAVCWLACLASDGRRSLGQRLKCICYCLLACLLVCCLLLAACLLLVAGWLADTPIVLQFAKWAEKPVAMAVLRVSGEAWDHG